MDKIIYLKWVRDIQTQEGYTLKELTKEINIIGGC